MDLKRWCTAAALFAALVLASSAFADKGGTPQASITLQNCDAKYCYVHNNTWTLTKDATANSVENGGTATWTITATKDSSGAATFTVHGGLTIYNSGTGPATIGNIVVNLQKPNSKKISGKNVPWVSVAADVANAISGDPATTANIVAAGSAESQPFNAAFGASNYIVSGAIGTFTETAGSGPLNFTDASNNTIFSIAPQPVIAVGQSITLLYDASFATSVLPAAGTPLRVEALVTFGNAGARGGSGSSTTNIDVNGDGVVDSTIALQTGELGANDADEANVRTVPCRVTLAPLPAAPEETNGSVTVSDGGVTATGTATTSNPAGFDALPATTSDTTSWNVSVDVDSGTDGGSVCNDAHLEGVADGGTLAVVVQFDTGVPAYDSLGNRIGWYATYTCAEAADADASSCVDVGPPTGFENGDFCTIGAGGWGAKPEGDNPGVTLATNFATVYPSGFVEVGIPGATGFSVKLNGAGAVCKYLPAGGTPAVLNADIVSSVPCSTGPSSPSTSSGVFGGQVLALKLTVDYAGFTGGTLGSIAGLELCNFGTGDPLAALNGQTITQLLVEANTVLGGGTGSYGLTVPQLNDLLDKVNNAFDGCNVGTFAETHLCK